MVNIMKIFCLLFLFNCLCALIYYYDYLTYTYFWLSDGGYIFFGIGMTSLVEAMAWHRLQKFLNAEGQGAARRTHFIFFLSLIYIFTSASLYYLALQASLWGALRVVFIHLLVSVGFFHIVAFALRRSSTQRNIKCIDYIHVTMTIVSLIAIIEPINVMLNQKKSLLETEIQNLRQDELEELRLYYNEVTRNFVLPWYNEHCDGEPGTGAVNATTTGSTGAVPIGRDCENAKRGIESIETAKTVEDALQIAKTYHAIKGVRIEHPTNSKNQTKYQEIILSFEKKIDLISAQIKALEEDIGTSSDEKSKSDKLQIDKLKILFSFIGAAAIALRFTKTTCEVLQWHKASNGAGPGTGGG